MLTALAALLGAVFTVAACYACGELALARLGMALRREEKCPLAFLLGASFLHLAVLAILALKIAYPTVLVGLLAAPVAAALLTGTWRECAETARAKPWPLSLTVLFWAVFVPFTALYL